MIGENLGLSSPGYWVWLGPALILVVAGLSTWIISHTTRAAIGAMAKAAGEVLSQAESRPQRRQGEPESLLVTEGRAAARFAPGSFLLRLERRVPAGEEAARSLDNLEESLIQSGIDPDDLQGRGVERGEGAAVALVSVRLSGEDNVRDVHRVALSCGFREDGARAREAFEVDDAQAAAGRRALARAISNVDVMRERLGIVGEVGLVEAHLSVDAPGDLDNTVVMRARATWRVVPAPLAA